MLKALPGPGSNVIDVRGSNQGISKFYTVHVQFSVNYWNDENKKRPGIAHFKSNVQDPTNFVKGVS